MPEELEAIAVRLEAIAIRLIRVTREPLRECSSTVEKQCFVKQLNGGHPMRIAASVKFLASKDNSFDSR